LRDGFDYFVPFDELCHAGQGQYEDCVEWKMGKCPDLLSDGTKMAAVETVEIEHVQEILFTHFVRLLRNLYGVKEERLTRIAHDAMITPMVEGVQAMLLTCAS
jgi:hypothetical protein